MGKRKKVDPQTRIKNILLLNAIQVDFGQALRAYSKSEYPRFKTQLRQVKRKLGKLKV